MVLHIHRVSDISSFPPPPFPWVRGHLLWLESLAKFVGWLEDLASNIQTLVVATVAIISQVLHFSRIQQGNGVLCHRVVSSFPFYINFLSILIPSLFFLFMQHEFAYLILFFILNWQLGDTNYFCVSIPPALWQCALSWMLIHRQREWQVSNGGLYWKYEQNRHEGSVDDQEGMAVLDGENRCRLGRVLHLTNTGIPEVPP